MRLSQSGVPILNQSVRIFAVHLLHMNIADYHTRACQEKSGILSFR